MANRLLYDLGLNIDPRVLPNSLYLTAEEAELRRQIYWSLYCVDKLVSGYTGCVCMMLVRFYSSTASVLMIIGTDS